MVCPCCGWEFSLEDEDGAVGDDGGLDSEGPFHVDEEGELSAENLVGVRCPFCTRVAIDFVRLCMTMCSSPAKLASGPPIPNAKVMMPAHRRSDAKAVETPVN